MGSSVRFDMVCEDLNAGSLGIPMISVHESSLNVSERGTEGHERPTQGNTDFTGFKLRDRPDHRRPDSDLLNTEVRKGCWSSHSCRVSRRTVDPIPVGRHSCSERPAWLVR